MAERKIPVFNQPTKYKIQISPKAIFKVNLKEAKVYVVENGTEVECGGQLTYIVS